MATEQRKDAKRRAEKERQRENLTHVCARATVNAVGFVVSSAGGRQATREAFGSAKWERSKERRRRGGKDVAHGLWANSITAEDYQELLDHGWRRSARLHKRMRRFLDGTISMKEFDSTKQKANSSMSLLKLAGNKSVMKMTALSTKESSASTFDNLHNEYDIIHSLTKLIDHAVSVLFGSNFLSIAQLPKAVVKKVTPQAKKKLMEISEDLVYTCSIAFQVAATIRHCQATDVIIQCQESELLDLKPTAIAEKWVPFEVARPLPDGNPCVVLSDSQAEHGCAMSPNHNNSVETSGPDPYNRAPIEDFCGEDEDGFFMMIQIQQRMNQV
ncbi:hypothetical protein OPV22_017235 [Ensete ventricosum]|uniref:Uncharacterized protein n=1 Tax=Ensete ventricosum TaxID=4639 RepID=A0AAV8PF20_ENSVE|nr:hypothetical protein OPV22_017235 [Ensete ventricosum]